MDGREGGSIGIKDYLNIKYTHLGIKCLLNFLSKLNCPGPFIKRIKKPPAIAIFFKKEVIWTWFEKSEWNIKAVAIQKRKRAEAEILVLYPTTINRGKIISNIIGGMARIAGILKSTIYSTVSS